MPIVDSYLLQEATDEVRSRIALLLPQVSSGADPLTRSRLDEIVGSDSTRIVVATLDNEIRGMALLCICTTLAGRFGLVEEVAVDVEARGHHVGVEIMVRLLEVAQDQQLDFVELTSRPSREAANGLYRSLGFEQRETNVYRHRLERIPPRRSRSADDLRRWRPGRPERDARDFQFGSPQARDTRHSERDPQTRRNVSDVALRPVEGSPE